jgi:hypothetical protein
LDFDEKVEASRSTRSIAATQDVATANLRQQFEAVGGAGKVSL